MKKILSIISSVAVLALASCSDVPAPYEIHNQGGSTTTIFSETFASSLGKFTNYTTSGAGQWVNDYSTAKAAGYDNTSKTTTDGSYYLVSPEIDLTGVDSAYVTYDYILRYNKGDENQRLVITDAFDATKPAEGWTTVNQTHTEGADWSTFSNTAVNIPQQFCGKKVRLALYYNCANKNGSTWEVKNFKVLKGKAGSQPGPQPVTEGIYYQSFVSDFGKCQNYTTSGEGAWIIDFKTAKATGYDNTTKVTTAGTYYLVTPEIALKDIEKAYVEYKYILRYNKGDENQQLLISTTWNEASPADGWAVLNQKNTEGTDWTTFATSQVQIPTEYIGKTVRLAFRYNTNATSGSTWEVQSVGVYEGEAGSTPTPTPGPTEGKGSGTATDPYNVAAITSICASGSIPSEKIYAKGIVSKIKEISTSYGNATYYISDDGTESGQFYVYRGYSLGGEKFQSESDLQVGDTVVVYGQLVDYNGTKEFTQGNQLYSKNGKGGGVTPTPGPDPEVTGISLEEFNNGGFENWDGNTPLLWKSSTTAGNATLSKSTDAHSGSFSVQVTGTSSANKRLGSTEITLEAGTYNIKFYAKAASGSTASARPGYVPVTSSGVGSYAYGNYTNDITDAAWVEITHTFTLSSKTTVNLVIMNSKTPGGTLLIDDYSITKE